MWRSGTVSRFSGGGAFEKSSRTGGSVCRIRGWGACCWNGSNMSLPNQPPRTAATALWLRPLLKSAEIEELRRGGSDNAEQHPRRDCQRNQRAAFGKDAPLFWLVGHALGPHKTENLPRYRLALRLSVTKSQITVKCVTTKRRNSPCPLWVNRVGLTVNRRLPLYPHQRTSSDRLGRSGSVESRMGAVAWGLWPTPRFPSPLIKPDVPISGIRLSDWLHREAHGDKLTARGFGTVSNSPSPLDTAISGGSCH